MSLKEKIVQKPNWKKIKAEFIAGSTLKELSEKYQISEATIESRHHREQWKVPRKEAARKRQEKTVEKIAEAQAQDSFDEIASIHKSIKTIDELVDSGNVEAYSLEGLLDKKAKLLQVLGTYTKKTSEEIRHSGHVQVTPIFGDCKLNVPSNDSD